MEVKRYKSLKEAVESITKESENYIFVRHKLNAGETIEPHCHPKANEFLVADNGAFAVELGRKRTSLRPDGDVVVIRFSKKRKHSLRTLAPTSYFVFRDMEDETIYCEEA